MPHVRLRISQSTDFRTATLSRFELTAAEDRASKTAAKTVRLFGYERN
jgi:hypothetical protein